MRAELPVLSFLCAAFLATQAPLHWKSRNVAILSIIVWLVVCNLTQGVNSVVWSGNTNIRVPVWCDIATKIRLAASVALPAACACVCRHLHFLSSNRDPKQRRHRMLLECSLCVLLPLLYMAFHSLVQEHRFDLAANFGCVPSTYTSIPAIILVWLPPLILCIISFSYASLALWSHLHRIPSLSSGPSFAPQLLTLTFLRPVTMAVVIPAFFLCSTVFSIYAHIVSSDGLLPWISWSQVHVHFSEVNIIPSDSHSDLVRIEVEWWVIPASSLVFIIMTIVGVLFGSRDETLSGLRSIGRWFNNRVLRQSFGMESFIDSSNMPSHIILKTPPTPTPVHLLKSGWDDTFRSNQSTEKVKPKVSPISCDTPPSPSSSDSDSDASFVVSTLSYLESSTGRQALGLPPPQAKSISSADVLNSDEQASFNNRLSVPPLAQNQVSGSPSSLTGSILSAPWPQPPSTIPTPTSASLSIPPVSHAHNSLRKSRPPSTSSLTTSLASSTISTHAYIHDPGFPLHDTQPHHMPFEGSGILAEVPTSTPPRRIRKLRSKESFSGRNLGLSLKRSGAPSRGEGSFGEGVYMTVVQETV